MRTRIYVFTGFLDSGKSSFIKDTITTTDFCDGETSVLLLSEWGETEYDEKELKKFDVDIEEVNSEDDWNLDFFNKIKEKYDPSQVFIELNGMWDIEKLMSCEKPEDWDIVQVLSTIDANTFESYINNMRSLLFTHLKYSDLVIFNRIKPGTKKSFLRNNIKAINGNCQIIYENEDGSINTIQDDELPFDTESDELVIQDHDFGLFCYDALDHPDKYVGKTITLKGMFIGRDKDIEDGFILGRLAMVCCEQDTSLIGMVCKHPVSKQLVKDEWVQVKGKISLEYDQKEDAYYCLLTADELKVVPPLEKPYVTFD